MPSADFWQTIRNPRESLSPDSRTSARPPGVSSPAFSAQPLDLQPESLMDMGFTVICPLARLGMPCIQFLFVGSRLCSTLLSDTLSRDKCPCVSLRLHLHQVGEGTFTPKLVNMPSTQKRRAVRPCTGFLLIRDLLCASVGDAANRIRYGRKSLTAISRQPLPRRFRPAGVRPPCNH